MKKAVDSHGGVGFGLGGMFGDVCTQQRMLSGGAMGASSGALIGWAAGRPRPGRPSAAAPGFWAVFSTISTKNPGAANRRLIA